MRSSVEITQNTRRWQRGLGVTGNQQGKMLRSQILEHLQTRQSSENLQIDCIPVPRSRCRCRKSSNGNGNSQHPQRYEIFSSANFAHFWKQLWEFPQILNQALNQGLPGKYATHQKCKHIKFMSNELLSVNHIIQIRAPIKSKQRQAARTRRYHVLWRVDQGTIKWFSHVQCVIWELIKNASILSHFVAHP